MCLRLGFANEHCLAVSLANPNQSIDHYLTPPTLHTSHPPGQQPHQPPRLRHNGLRRQVRRPHGRPRRLPRLGHPPLCLVLRQVRPSVRPSVSGVCLSNWVASMDHDPQSRATTKCSAIPSSIPSSIHHHNERQRDLRAGQRHPPLPPALVRLPRRRLGHRYVGRVDELGQCSAVWPDHVTAGLCVKRRAAKQDPRASALNL